MVIIGSCLVACKMIDFKILSIFWAFLVIFWVFSIFWAIFRKNGYVPEKNFQREKIFKIDIFVLKHVLDHSKSIPTKKNFEKFSIFWSPIFRKTAMSKKKFSTGKNFQNRYFRFKTLFGPF